MLTESVLKTNDNLEFAVITGCLRVSRESIFTGLNNLKVISILDESFAEYFGFTPAEVEEMAEFYGSGSRFEEMKRWYDGYLFGSTEVYNPWSVINYVDDVTSLNTQYPKPYWSNTSSNSIVRELVEKADSVVTGRDPAVVMEVKRVRKFSRMEAACDRALRQIRERNYASGLMDDGCREVLEYGFCFCRKNCMVKVVKRDVA